ncbi:MAG: hypothetical protein GY832_27395 [Chloroflexi bacterium]|nr:hypothetical protein [Chloroflexota bacterium]
MTDLKETHENETESVDGDEKVVEITTPIVVNLGKQRPKRIKALKRGRGKLMDQVGDVLDQVQMSLGDEAEGKTLVPVILLYERKKKRKQRFRMFRF